MRFDADDVPALLADADVARASLAAVECVRTGSVAAIRTELERGTSAVKVAFAASVQGLSALVARLPDLRELPAELSVHLRNEEEQTAARGRKLAGHAREALRLLRDAGTPAIPLKGAALLLRGDVDPALRPMGDIDLLLLDPSRIDEAARALRPLHYRAELSTPRHLVLVEEDERVAAPASEHPDNPIRIELHRTFRLPVLGVHIDATRELVDEAIEGDDQMLLPSPAAMFRHLWIHAANDFGGNGIRGIGAVDFVNMAKQHGPLQPTVGLMDRHAIAPLLYAVDAIEGLFPGTFDGGSVEGLARHVPAELRERARSIPPLRHCRPSRNWTKIALGIAPTPFAKSRFLVRTAFPAPGEVKANFAPDATGFALAMVYARVLVRRAERLLH